MSTTTSSDNPAPSQQRGKMRTVKVNLRIERCDGPGKPAYWETFQVDADPTGNVLSCLQLVAANPTTVEGKKSKPVVWDSGCLEQVCGACTMRVNGKVRQSCTALVNQYVKGDGETITLQPMSKFPVVRDLVVDRERMFHNQKRIKGWVPIDGTYHLGPGPKETPEKQETRYKLSECMTCGCCLDACPQFEKVEDPKDWDTAFIGAQPISLARLFNLHDTGSTLENDRLEVLSSAGGVSACGNAQNCVKVCPKEIPLTESIAAMGRAVTFYRVKKFFAGKK
jgi:succinate dehydrogenase / fumarate reductase iron-sulfur subunit